MGGTRRKESAAAPGTVAGTVELLQQQQLSGLFGCSSKGSKDSDVEECSLCLQAFASGERVTTLPCCHYYHTECISKWFAAQSYATRCCPLCKSSPLDAPLPLDAAPVLPAVEASRTDGDVLGERIEALPASDLSDRRGVEMSCAGGVSIVV